MISFIVITHAEHAAELGRMINSLPTGVEICVVMTVKGNEEKFEIGEDYEHDGRKFRHGLFTWAKHFNFSKARNHSIDLATNDWLFWIDSDDVLLREQHDDIKALDKLPAGIGGVIMGVVGAHAVAESNNELDKLYMAVPQARAFRKSTGVRFMGIVHEQILPQLKAERFAVINSSIIIAHLGYAELDYKSFHKKVKRNISLLTIQLATDATYAREYYEGCLMRGLVLLKQLEDNKTWQDE